MVKNLSLGPCGRCLGAQIALLSARFTAGSLKKQLIAKPVTEGRLDEVGVMSSNGGRQVRTPTQGRVSHLILTKFQRNKASLSFPCLDHGCQHQYFE